MPRPIAPLLRPLRPRSYGLTMNEQRPPSSVGSGDEIDRGLSGAIVRFLCELHEALAYDIHLDLPRPDQMLSECQSGRWPGRFEAYLAELSDRSRASHALLHGQAVRLWAERKQFILDPNRYMLKSHGLLATTRKARAFDLLRPVIAELRPEIVEQEIDAVFRTLRRRTRSLNRRARSPTLIQG